MLFCDKLQQLRHNAKLTQDEFAVHIGISRQAISKWESGAAYPDLKNLQLICAFFDISPDLLLNDKRDLSKENEAFYCFDLNEIGNAIRSVRMARGIGQEAFAELLGVSRQSVSKWENGTALPKTEILLNIIKELDTDLGELLPAIQVRSEAPVFPNKEPLDAHAEQRIPPSAPNRKKRRYVWIVLPCTLILASLLALLAVGLKLTTPFLNADPNPLGSLFTELFFDVDEISGIPERWKREGVELTLGSGENEITVKVKVSDSNVTIANLSAHPIILPRQNAKATLEKSDFHYESDSPMALSEEQYDAFLSFLELIEKKPNSIKLTDALQEVLKIALDAGEKILSPTVEYRLADESFQLKKDVTVEADLADLSALLTAIADEVKKNEELNGILETFGMFESPYASPMYNLKLDTVIREIQKEMVDTYTSRSFTLTYTVIGGTLTRITLSEQSVDKEKGQYDNFLVFTPLLADGSKGFSVKSSSRFAYEGISDTQETEYVYQRSESNAKTDLSLTVESRYVTDNGNVSQSYTSKETHTLNYDKSAKTFSYRHRIPELESESQIQGIWELDVVNGLCRFGILKWTEDEMDLLDTSSAILSIRTLGEETFDGGEELFAMSSESWIAFYRQSPLKKVDALWTDITGFSPEFLYTKQEEPIPHSAQLLAQSCTKAFQDYVTGKEAQTIPTNRIRVYSTVHGLHILLSKNSDGSISITYTAHLTDFETKYFHEATLQNGKLTVHRIEKISRQEPTCTQAGRENYQCTDCLQKYSVSLPELGHAYTYTTMSVVTDENINLVAECESCSRCNLKFNASIRETASPYSNLYCSIWVEPTGNGGYTVTDYYWISGYCEIFSVPDNLSEYLSINSLRLSGRGYDLIRIPSGVQRLTANTNFTIGPKVLILPSSLTEIANGVFLDFSRLETIYYCGTEEQWNEVKLNGYRNAWKDVNVIFCPEGVSPEVAANSGY